MQSQNLLDFLWTLGPWSWLLAAGVLILLETVIPGVHFLWFGLAAAATGAVAFASGLSWPWQLVVFTGFSIATVFLVRDLSRRQTGRSEAPDLNERGAQYVGRVVTVEDAISGGRGRVRVGDTLWPASGPDSPKGAQVKVTGCDGTVLRVGAA